ncbi:MAG: DUF3365 domain-containing protein [Sandaracinaceae bacterium]
MEHPRRWERAELAALAGLLLAAWSLSACEAPGTPDEPAAAEAADAPSAAPRPEPTAEELDEARALAGRFMGELASALQTAIRERGAPAAIDVCATEAPGIATQLSQREGWAVGRTSLRARNPRNAPSVRERAVLMRFEARHAAGEPAASLEHAEVLGDGDATYVHFMRAIPTGALCLTCHGSEVTSDVLDAIRARYPADAATGYAAGDLRGAFTFVKPRGEGASGG